MSKINVFFANGHEEIEGLTVIDLLRRAGLEVDIVSINEEFGISVTSILFSAFTYSYLARILKLPTPVSYI